MSTPPVRSNKVTSAGQEAAEARAEFGRWLRQQREVRDIELDEVARATRVSIRYLQALEEGRFELLPAPVFARGFLREYARYVGLDADETVNSYLTALQRGRDDEEQRHDTASSKRRLLVAGGAVVAALLLATLGIWWWSSRDESTGDAALVPAPARSAVRESTAPPTPPPTTARQPAEGATAPLVVTLDFRAGSWVEAVVDGQPVVSEERLQGESLTLRAEERVLLSLDRPQAVDVLVNGEPVTLQAGPDGAVRDHEIALPESPVSPPSEAARE